MFFVVFSDASRDGSERRRSSSRGIYSNPNNSRHGSEPGILKFTMEEINKATKNFSPSFKIGQGGFGTVYKGRLGDGTLVAIKRAKKVGYKFVTLYSISHVSMTVIWLKPACDFGFN